MYIAKVIIGISTNSLDRLFSYIIPEMLVDEIEVGSVVEVPFGKNNKIKEAYIIEIGLLTKKPEFELKKISRIKENVSVINELIKLSFWMHKRYLCPITSALKLMIPRDSNCDFRTEKVYNLNKEKITEIKNYIKKNNENKNLKKRIDLLAFILKNNNIYTSKVLCEKANTTIAIINGLVKKKYLNVENSKRKRIIEVLENKNSCINIEPNKEQETAISKIELNKQKTYLLHGITGSGKTVVYIEIVKKIIKEGKQAIVLIPEIGLTPQTISRFVAVFGNVVGVMHSRLNDGERYEQWIMAKQGEIKIMIGARSAIFTPFDNLGIVIIDEEHEHTYKSEKNPRYTTREVAIKRSMYYNCPVLLGSATPSLESYYKAKNGIYELLELNNNAVIGASKKVHIVDMCKEFTDGNTSVISNDLRNAIEKALTKKEQILLFINRRGYANTISCRSCGYVYKCDNCDVSMTYHKTNKRLICHICGASKELKKVCPECGSKYIKGFGIGTQKVVNIVKEIFPLANIARMDQDTTSTKHGHEEILNKFANKEIDILIGTQMIVKGHDFHNVTVVGVLAADLGLNIEDFRAGERTFQLITQVIGRTGRGKLKGDAYIQTYQVDNYAVQASIKEEYKEFYNEEILYRKMLGYPPFNLMLQVIASSENDKLGYEFLKKCDTILKNEKFKIELLGPAPTTIGRVKGKYRFRLLIKSESYKELKNAAIEIKKFKENNEKYKHMNVIIDFNPVNIL